MPESLLSRRLKLGTFLGIGLYVHWSFSLAVLLVVFRSLPMGWVAVAFGIAQLFGVFFCVTLHEYGHAMAARVFGIGTADITLLPIGGVARLRRMPRIPWQELIVAVAGPAVNVVIVMGLVVGLLLFADAESMNVMRAFVTAMFTGGSMDEESSIMAMQLLTEPSWLGFGILMVFINAMLVLFNMIPAFPMDGGRVFRSLLAMTMNYSRATSIASKVGLVCAAIIAWLAINTDPPSIIPVLIAVFIGYAGVAEARQVKVMEMVRGFTVGDVMVQTDRTISMDTPLSQLAQIWRRTSERSLPVTAITGSVVGTLQLEDIAKAIANGKSPDTTAGQLINYNDVVETVYQNDDLASALSKAGKSTRQIPVVDLSGHLIGILDLDSTMARRSLPRMTAEPDNAPFPHFDAIT